MRNRHHTSYPWLMIGPKVEMLGLQDVMGTFMSHTLDIIGDCTSFQDGFTALMFAVRNGNAKMVQILLERKASTEMRMVQATREQEWRVL